MLERELKFLLDKTDYNRLLTYTKQYCKENASKHILQINYYYDTENFMLYRQDITLRVRERNGRYKIEKKEVLAALEGCRTAKESEYPVASLPEILHSADVEIAGEFVFQCLGHLETLRTSFVLRDGTKLEFDENRFFGMVDYELEIEVQSPEQAPDWLLKQIPRKYFKNNPEGKYTRFISEFIK